MLTREPRLNALVTYLEEERQRILAEPGAEHELRFSRRALQRVRRDFSRMIRRGETKLHRLCELLVSSLMPTSYTLQSVVVGEALGERFTLVQGLSQRELYSRTDLDLGNRQLEKLRFSDGKRWHRPELVANFVEYEAVGPNELGVHKFISRIKAEEEIWNKVVDEIFGLDQLVSQDKELRHLSRYVKDVFGIKIVASDEERARQLQRHLEEMSWSAEQLDAHRVSPGPETCRLEFLEVKDYLDGDRGKESGWRALKSVVTWWETPMEIQIQPLPNYHRERERVTRESHAEFKARRESLRNQIAGDVPLFAFYRDLLRWLFLCPGEAAPRYRSIRILVED